MKKSYSTKLVFALVLFVVSVIGLTGATYAWFTNVIKNSVENMNFYAKASDSMMLSALENPQQNHIADWFVSLQKSEITSADRGNQAQAFPNNMLMVSSVFGETASGFHTVSYSSTGELNGYISVSPSERFAKFFLWAKTTRSGFIYIDSDSFLQALSDSEPKNAIAYSVRVGFVPVDYDENGNAEGGVINGEAWDYAVIWEPNSKNHLSSIYGGPPEGSGKLITQAVKNSVAVANPINTADLDEAVSLQTTYDFTQNGTNIIGAGFYDAAGQPINISYNNKIALFNMNADTMQRFNVYIWAEGSDQDAVDAVAKSFFRTYIKFGQEYDKFLGNEFIPKN